MSLKLNLPVEGLIKKTIFEHFAGGETMEDCKPTIKTMFEAKLHSILDYSVEGKETEEAKTDVEFSVSDLNNDGILNVLDIVQLVNIILYGSFGR